LGTGWAYRHATFVGENSGRGNASDPAIFAAVREQSGLKLQASKELLEVLVMDRAGKVPIENQLRLPRLYTQAIPRRTANRVRITSGKRTSASSGKRRSDT